MESELKRLRKEVADAEKTAANDQDMLIRAAEERMFALDKVCTAGQYWCVCVCVCLSFAVAEHCEVNLVVILYSHSSWILHRSAAGLRMQAQD